MVNGISGVGGGYNYSSTTWRTESPEVLAARRVEMEARRAEAEAEAAEKRAVAETSQCVSDFVAVRDQHIAAVATLGRCDTAVSNSKRMAQQQPSGPLQGLAWALLNIIGCSPRQCYARALTRQSEARAKLEQLRKIREAALRRARNSASQWYGRYHWDELDAEDGILRC